MHCCYNLTSNYCINMSISWIITYLWKVLYSLRAMKTEQIYIYRCKKAQWIPLAVPPLPRKYLYLTAGRGASRTNLTGVLRAKGEAFMSTSRRALLAALRIWQNLNLNCSNVWGFLSLLALPNTDARELCPPWVSPKLWAFCTSATTLTCESCSSERIKSHLCKRSKRWLSPQQTNFLCAFSQCH